MARIPLTIDPDYCSSWGWWEGVREIVQNAKDADEYDAAPMTIEHFPRTNRLVISSRGVTLEPRVLLLLGASTKRGAGQRGQFGEGFAIGCLALVRAGHPVTIHNGDEVWRPTIQEPDEGHPFEGERLLVFTTRKLKEMRDAFSVEIENVSADVWDIAKKLFLFVSPPLPGGTVGVSAGRILLDEEYRGKIYSKGIFVNLVEDLECGYDLDRLELDRDRKVIDEFNLRWKLSNLLSEAHKNDPEKFSKRIYNMAKEGKADVKSLSYHADKALLQALQDAFKEEHGEEAVPVQTTAESKEIEALGGTPVVANSTLRELLEKTGLSAISAKEKLRSGVKQTYTWAALSPEEQGMCEDYVDRVTKYYTIVDFNDDSVLCQKLPVAEGDVASLGISRSLLASTPRDVTDRVVYAEATRRGVSDRTIYLDLLFPDLLFPEV